MFPGISKPRSTNESSLMHTLKGFSGIWCLCDVYLPWPCASPPIPAVHTQVPRSEGRGFFHQGAQAFIHTGGCTDHSSAPENCCSYHTPTQTQCCLSSSWLPSGVLNTSFMTVVPVWVWTLKGPLVGDHLPKSTALWSKACGGEQVLHQCRLVDGWMWWPRGSVSYCGNGCCEGMNLVPFGSSLATPAR